VNAIAQACRQLCFAITPTSTPPAAQGKSLVAPCCFPFRWRDKAVGVPVNCIDFAENKITFPTPKGGEDRAFSVPMPTALRPLLER